MRKTSYRDGTPTWVDVSTPDIDATTEFYGALFGWKAAETSDDFGGYIRYELDGEAVAGAGVLGTGVRAASRTGLVRVYSLRKAKTARAPLSAS